ncbi:M3 family metallopeptidase [Chengkuizengella sp. SCS-71B]|uniref:M3 family metallopeptidase n=1 Tax=Chengkuizengella sp. SCS-71B TaxID=3115290 RepID=UPI0032C211CA
MKPHYYHPTQWNIKKLYPNEIDHSLSNELHEIKLLLNQLKIEPDSELIKDHLVDKQRLYTLADVRSRIEKADYYCYCLYSESTDHVVLSSLQNDINQCKNDFRSLLIIWTKYINQLPIEIKKQWTTIPYVESFFSNLIMDYNDELKKHLINLTKTELTQWNQFYNQLKNKLEVNMNDDEQRNVLSYVQANDITMNHKNLNQRVKAFNALTNSLDKEKELYATVLNQITRLRLIQNQDTKKEDILSESLRINGISNKTLHTMWRTVDENNEKLTSILNFKKKNEGTSTWHQFMTDQIELQTKIPFSKAAEGIYCSLKEIEVEMAQFVLNAIENEWVDAQPREGKHPGGFCVPFIRDGESRISLRYDGTIQSARILAHELGHAWHFRQLKDTPSLTFLEDHFPMSIAESSSILFEFIFIDHFIETSDPETKKSILNYKLQNSINYLMSVRGAFMFEQLLYEHSIEGPLNANQIEELSIQSQKKAYYDTFKQYQPFVWIKYGHFYNPSIPFYNYPYTFGYLLSLGLFTIAKQEGIKFSVKFKGFLSETGKKPVEELLQQYFHIDLKNPNFWQQSIDHILKDIEEYIKLADIK